MNSLRRLGHLGSFCAAFVNGGLRTVLAQLKVLLLFDKNFDFSVFTHACDAFRLAHFKSDSSENLSRDRSNFSRILSQAAKATENVGIASGGEALVESGDVGPLLLDWSLLVEDLELFTQELGGLEETVQHFMEQVWLLQSCIRESLRVAPVAQDSPGTREWGLVNLARLHSESLSSVAFLFRETIKKVVNSGRSHFALLALGLPKLLRTIDKLVE